MDASSALVYTKDSDSLPLTSMIVENQPCFNNVGASASGGTEYLPYEIERSSSCPVEAHSGLESDSRY